MTSQRTSPICFQNIPRGVLDQDAWLPASSTTPHLSPLELSLGRSRRERLPGIIIATVLILLQLRLHWRHWYSSTHDPYVPIACANHPTLAVPVPK